MTFSGYSWPTLTNPLLNGLKKTFNFPVEVVGNGTFEYRVGRSQYSRLSWEFPARSLLDSDRDKLVQLYNLCGGSLASFLFADPDYNTITDYQIGTGTMLAPPSGVVATVETTGGTIPASTTRNYVVTAVGSAGESLPSSQVSATTGTGTTSSVVLTWSSEAGATSYNIYQGGYLIGSSATATFTDINQAAGTQNPPTQDQSGTYNIPLVAPIAGILHPIFHPSNLQVSYGGQAASGVSVEVMNGMPYLVFTSGQAAAYNVPITISCGFSFAVRFNGMAGYALNVVGVTSGYQAVKFDEVFE